MAVIGYFTSLLSGVVAIQVEKILNASVVFYGAGTLAILASIFLAFGLKDVHN